MFDRDSNGYITLDELQRAMQMIGEDVTDAQLNDMLALADLDKDGKINYEGKQKCLEMKWTGFYILNIFIFLFRVRKIALVINQPHKTTLNLQP